MNTSIKITLDETAAFGIFPPGYKDIQDEFMLQMDQKPRPCFPMGAVTFNTRGIRIVE